MESDVDCMRKKDNMKIGIFGGTFDPFTPAHAAIVNEVLKQKLADVVYVAPTITNWYRSKDDKWLTDAERADVCRHGIEELVHGNAVLWTNDIDRKNAIERPELQEQFAANWHFIDTLFDMKAEFAKKFDEPAEIRVIVGSDQFEFFPKWHRFTDILSLAKLIVVQGREHKTVNNGIPHFALKIDSKFADVSATKIRNQYRNMISGIEQYKKEMLNKMTTEKTVYSSPIWNVVEKFDVDHKIGFNPVGINSPDWVTILAKWSSTNEFIVVEQLRYGLMKNFVEFPSGIVDKGETPLHAAKRELKEETGYDVSEKDFEYLGKCAANPAFMNNCMHFFYVDLDACDWKKTEQDLDENEKLTVGKMTEAKLLDSLYDVEDDSSVFMSAAVLKMMQRKRF